MDRDARIGLRVSVWEKELWVAAAGGDRKLSVWMRERCNQGVGLGDEVEDALLSGTVLPVEPHLEPPPEPHLQPPVVPEEPEPCPRAFFHRVGAFCRACGEEA